MSGQRQPVELVIAKGNKHLTKAEIEERFDLLRRRPAYVPRCAADHDDGKQQHAGKCHCQSGRQTDSVLWRLKMIVGA